MGIKEGEVKYYLKKPFKYANQGQTTEASHILLREPGMEHQNGYYKLTQFITKAQMQAAGQARKFGFGSQEEIEDIVGEEAVPLNKQTEEIENESREIEEFMSMAVKMADIDIVEFMKTFQKIAIKPGARKSIALVDGNPTIPLTQTMLDKMHPDEAFDLAIKYCSFFVTAVDTPLTAKSEQPQESDTSAVEV